VIEPVPPMPARDDWSPALLPHVLRSNRLTKRRTSAEQADVLGVNPGQYQKWEDGKARPRLRAYISALAAELGATEPEVASLCGRRPPDAESPPPEPIPPLEEWPEHGFGEMLRKLRIDAGLTQGQLGTFAGASFGSVSNWERSVASPTIAAVAAMEKALGLQPRSLERLIARTPRRRSHDDAVTNLPAAGRVIGEGTA
jgi:transcriptional regulator with XRE-family HTH domain